MISEIKGLQQHTVKGPGAGSHAVEQTENKAARTENKENQSSSSSAHEVSLTDTSTKLRELEAKIANQPVVDTQKVETVKKAISDGTYKVNAKRTAEKMAEFESLLSSKIGDK